MIGDETRVVLVGKRNGEGSREVALCGAHAPREIVPVVTDASASPLPTGTALFSASNRVHDRLHTCV